MRATKCLPIYLDAELYRQLERIGRTEDRDPIQQARWILRRALAAEGATLPADDRLTAAAPRGPGEAA